MAETCYSPKYLVLHFVNGALTSTKVTRSWRGAQMSKRNHERPHSYRVLREVFHYNDAQIAAIQAGYDTATRILPIDTILALKGLERPDTDLSANDMALLKSMGIE